MRIIIENFFSGLFLHIYLSYAAYSPDYVIGWNTYSWYVTGSGPYYWNVSYSGISGPPRNYFVGIAGLRTSTSGRIDFQVTSTLLSDKMMVVMNKGATVTADYFNIPYMVTNDSKLP